MFRIVPGPPQSCAALEERTETSAPSPNTPTSAAMSGRRPCAMARTVSKGKATVIGTGNSSRISRCRHFARLPVPLGPDLGGMRDFGEVGGREHDAVRNARAFAVAA